MNKISLIFSIFGMVISIIGVGLSLYFFSSSNKSNRKSVKEITDISKDTTSELKQIVNEHFNKLKSHDFKVKIRSLDDYISEIMNEIRQDIQKNILIKKQKGFAIDFFKYELKYKSVFRKISQINATPSQNMEEKIFINIFLAAAPFFEDLMTTIKLSNENTKNQFTPGKHEILEYQLQAFEKFVTLITNNHFLKDNSNQKLLLEIQQWKKEDALIIKVESGNNLKAKIIGKTIVCLSLVY